LDYSNETRWVDLRINGEYRGNYLLSEKVQTGTNRVELQHPQGIVVELDHRGDGTQPGYPAEDYWFHSATSKSTFVLKDAASDYPDKVDGPLTPEGRGWLGRHAVDPEQARRVALCDAAPTGPRSVRSSTSTPS
jgi:hypothetical protein